MAGMYLEDFHVGDVIRHAQTRTVTETDNVLFNSMTMNPQPLHLDAHFAAGSHYGERIVNAVFTLGLVVGIPVYETTLGTTLGHLSYEEITFPAPVRHGDTLRVETEVLDARESKSKPDRGVVKLEHRGFNQDDTLICKVVRLALMSRRVDDQEA
jgi:acyl dehydratase